MKLGGANVASAFVISQSSVFRDRKSTRLNSSHANISYAVFCLKKKKIIITFFSPPHHLHSTIHVYHVSPLYLSHLLVFYHYLLLYTQTLSVLLHAFSYPLLSHF